LTISRAGGLLEEATVVDLLSAPSVDPAVLGRWLSVPPRALPGEIESFHASGVSAFHFAWGIAGEQAHDVSLHAIAAMHRVLIHLHQTFVPVLSTADIALAKASGRIGIVMGFQNSEHFRTEGDGDLFHGLGQRISQLTYNERNRLGSGCLEKQDEGLSEFGVEVVRRMNRLGMAVDVSHCGERTTREAIEASAVPILVTHAACRALNDHPRCKSDAVIRALAERGGVFGLCFIGALFSARLPARLDDVLAHLDHLVEIAGAENVAIGSDLGPYGYGAVPGTDERTARHRKWDIPGLDHPGRLLELSDALLRRGWKEAAVVGLLGANAIRVLAEIWR
jgi:membrane dipeptidase